MNLLLLLPEDLESPSRARLKDYRATHIREILRSFIGHTLKVGLVNGPVGLGKVVEISRNEVVLDLNFSGTPPVPPDMSLILALPRPQTLKKVLESTAAFGLHQLALVGAEQVEKSFFSSKLLKDKVWEKHQRLGLEQGGRTFLPLLSLHKSLKVFLEKALPQWDAKPPTKLVCHPGTASSLWDTPLASPHERHPILAAIGPEGGWRDEEVRIFQEHGFQTIHLGRTIHRVENAVTSLLGQIEFLQMKCLSG